MFLLLALVACTPADSGDLGSLPTPTVTFITPLDGETVTVGDVAVSVLVTDFLLSDPAQHGEGAPEGYLELAWTDGTTSDTVQTGSTTATLPFPTPGAWTLTADLHFADGDAVDAEFADYTPASITLNVE